MIDTDKIDNMKQWTNDYKVRMFWDLVAEIKRLHKGIKEATHHLTYPAKYDKEVKEQTDKLKEMIE